jgi:ArsR family transcriptional regulator, arsenate/arsenite/antimonite-responsive transcriptional repressor
METSEVVTALAALAQESRLAVYRLLVSRGPEGFVAGDIAERLGIAAPTLSFHLKALTHAGLIQARREGRFLHYRANFERMNAVLAFMTENCCSLATTCEPGTCAPRVAPVASAARG